MAKSNEMMDVSCKVCGTTIGYAPAIYKDVTCVDCHDEAEGEDQE